jgi:hypothetical protein
MKSILAILPSLLGSIMLLVQTKLQNTHTNNASNTARVKAIRVDDLIKWRQRIHENAQVSLKKRIQVKMLKASGNIEIIQPAKTSVIGILKD